MFKKQFTYHNSGGISRKWAPFISTFLSIPYWREEETVVVEWLVTDDNSGAEHAFNAIYAIPLSDRETLLYISDLVA
jgi:hypothetical protein